MADATRPKQIRIDDDVWKAYKRVCADNGTTPTDDLRDHIRRTIKEHGDPEALRLLGQGLEKMAARRERMVAGRPPKAAPEA